MRLATLLFFAALAAHATTFYVTISGLGGEADYDQRFKMWADDIDSSLKKAGGDSNVITLVAPTREQIRAKFGGSGQTGQTHRFPGADADRARHLRRHGLQVQYSRAGHQRRGTGGAAGARSRHAAVRGEYDQFQRRRPSSFLRKPNRVVITATKAGTEKNATVFARYWAEALRDPAADVDKNESISALEAFHYAQHKTTEFFDTQKRLATEHSVLEDTGKGEGEKGPSAENGEGRLAAAFPLVRLGANAAAAQNPAKRPLLDRKGATGAGHRQAEVRQGRHSRRHSTNKQLTALLLELAKVQEALDKQ